MLKSLSRIVPVLLALGLAGCSIYVKSDVNRALIGSVHCGSYAWAGTFHGSSPLRNSIANPLNEERLRSAIAAHVPGGTVQPLGTNADCLIGYGIGSNYVIDGAWPYGYGWGYGWGWAGPYVYREGIIAVDLYDAKSRQPLWHAAAEQSLFGLDGDKAARRIDAAVAAIFSKYPG
ncbi:MAG: DUF4136 domain-containing protein [Gammaproteobacteria bacterium]|nr:DUF4136 domain-containing protein [Gammaproteobacteria bacterium]MBV9696472.1 DUF4136 domain-containing protein [Gammaproteobacteria bacterium]